MTTSQIIFLIIGVIYICNSIRVRFKHISYYLNVDGNFANFIGAALASMIEGCFWYYIINTILNSLS